MAPPEECSRCGTLVAQTSLFCPSCGQSRVTPLEAPEPEPDPEAEAKESENSASEVAQDESASDATRTTGDTLTRATQWIRRTLGGEVRVPVDPDANEAGAVDQPGEPEDSPLLSDQTRPPSYPERLQQSSRARARFVLQSADGHTYTLGEIPGGIGSGDSAPEGDRLQWIQLVAPDGSVDAVHLRFGVDDGVLWVEDANSVFGTIVVEPGRAPLQCIPYERYHLVRGSEIRLGSVHLTLG